MATIQDLYHIRQLLETVKEDTPTIRYLGEIAFSYSPVSDCYIATIDCDLDIWFTDIEYRSDRIYLVYEGRSVASFCHLHQRL